MAIDQKQLSQIDRWLSVGDLKKAEAQIARLLRMSHPPAERAVLMLRRARARVLLERPDEALEDLQTLHALTPDQWERSDVQELLGDAYFTRFELAPLGFAERADAVKARAAYEGIEVRDPAYENLGWVLYQWGRILLTEGNIESALDKFTQALLKSTTVPRLTAMVYERLGFICLTEKRDPHQAQGFFTRAVQTYPAGEPTAWLMRLHLLRSRAFKEQNLYDDALRAAQIALNTLNPQEPDYRSVLTEGHLMLGEILAGIPGREREAADHLLQFLQYSKKPQGVDVTWSRIHETLGELWFRLERYEQAITAYKTALSFNPYHPLEIQLYYQIARSAYRLRQYENTIETVERMIKVSHDEQQTLTDYRVYGLLANARFALEQYVGAVQAFEQALALAPNDADNLDKYRTYLKAAQELAAKGN
jgi:tetratricopeptide (TPR) repeat protein